MVEIVRSSSLVMAKAPEEDETGRSELSEEVFGIIDIRKPSLGRFCDDRSELPD